MFKRMKSEFPELYTKTGKLSKKKPKHFVCECGHTFNRTQNQTVGGFKIGVIICEECGNSGKKNVAHDVWERMMNTQMQQEDFLLEVIKERGSIEKKELIQLQEEAFPGNYESYERKALGYLCYFGYLNVKKEVTNDKNLFYYSINPEIDTDSRYGIPEKVSVGEFRKKEAETWLKAAMKWFKTHFIAYH